MKTLFQILLATGCTVLTSAAFAVNGPGISGGGDEYSLAFVNTAHEVTEWLKLNGHSLAHPVDADVFERAVQTTTVASTTQPLILDGAQKDAINYPDAKKIVFSRESWDRIQSVTQRKALVFHEYLGILKIPDQNYEISSSISKAVSVVDQRKICEAICDFFEKKPTANDISTCMDGYFGKLLENSESAGPKILYFGAPYLRAKWQTCLIDTATQPFDVVNCAQAKSSVE